MEKCPAQRSSDFRSMASMLVVFAFLRTSIVERKSLQIRAEAALVEPLEETHVVSIGDP